MFNGQFEAEVHQLRVENKFLQAATSFAKEQGYTPGRT